MNFAGFEKIAPYLASPLVLVGFVLMLAYSIHWQLMKSGLLSKVDKKDSGLIIRLFLRYGFWLALMLLLAGFGLAAWNNHLEAAKIISIDVRKTAELLSAQLGVKDQQLSAKDEQIKALTEAIVALSKTGAPAKSINDALQELEQGNTAKAQAIFAEVLNTKEAEGQKANKEAAAVARHLGALAFGNNPKEALVAYQKSVQLDPENTDGWNQLGSLFLRTGELPQAEAAYHKVLALCEVHNDSERRAEALANLGNVYFTRGELNKAEEMHKRALGLNAAFGRKEGMAANHDKLGDVYFTRKELNKAEKMYKNALELNQALDSKEGMAKNYSNLGCVYYLRNESYNAEEMQKKSLKLNEARGAKEDMAANYANLGSVYKQRGNFTQAEDAWKKSLMLYQEMGSPNVKMVQQLLDKLAQHKAGGSR